jgi:hypothetical protein
VLYKLNSGSDEAGQTSSVPAQTVPVPAAAAPRKLAPRITRRPNKTNDRATLRLRAVDARSGDIDPTLRLDLLERLQAVQASGGSRSLFEPGAPPTAAPAQAALGKVIVPTGPKSGPGTTTTLPVSPVTPAIPLKFYGFVRPKEGGTNRGFFMDGDNILVGSEGDLLMQRYRIVQLTSGSVVMEDMTTKSRQTLPLVPEAQLGG